MRQRLKWVLAAAGILLAVAMPALGSTPEADGMGPFADVDGSVHELDVAALWSAGITSGCAEWLFCPDDEVTRAEMAAFLARALDLPRPDESTFVDAAESMFAAEIEAIAAADITMGCRAGEYCPQEPVTRGQMASLLVRALDVPSSDEDAFVDDDGNVHEGDIGALAAAEITHGCGEGSFCPDIAVTRAEMASFLTRALELEVPVELDKIPLDVIEQLDEVEVPTGPGAEGWRPLVEVYFPANEVDRAIRVMHCESQGDPRARNPRSGASGLFQHMPRYWPERAAGAGFPGASVFDAEANIAAAAYLIYDHPGGGWKHWVCK